MFKVFYPQHLRVLLKIVLNNYIRFVINHCVLNSFFIQQLQERKRAICGVAKIFFSRKKNQSIQDFGIIFK